jgi:hypothetical protein
MKVLVYLIFIIALVYGGWYVFHDYGNSNNEAHISGTVLLGPTCPVVQDPPQEECADKPYETTLVLTTPDGAETIKTFSSNAEGRFTVDANPGTYVIRSAAAANVLPYCSSNSFTLIAGGYAEIVVSCDTGIR